MKVAVITVCFNEENRIISTLISFAEQTYPDKIHLIKDGFSKDGTKHIVESFPNSQIKFIQVRDTGIYNALNFAIQNVDADIIGVLHSGDIFYDSKIISIVVNTFKETNCDILYGDLEIRRNVKIKNSKVRYWKAGKFKKTQLSLGWMPPHPTVFVKKRLFEEIGLYSENFRISSDYEWLLRVFKRKDLRIMYLNKPITIMEAGGLSQRLLFLTFAEDILISLKHGYFFAAFLKRIRKIPQLFRNKRN